MRKRRNVSDTPENVNCRCAAIPNVSPEMDYLINDIAAMLGMKEMLASIPVVDEKYVPERILKSGNATVVFWKDGSKTVVKCGADTTPNDYEAFTAALGIKIFGSNSQLKKAIKNLTVEQKPKKKKGEE